MILILMILRFETYAATLTPPPLFDAIETSNVDAVRDLASLETANQRFDDSYPLKRAIKKGNCDMVKALLDAKAEVNPSPEDGKAPPLFLACRKGGKARALVELLLNRGADPAVLVDGDDLFGYCIRKRAWNVAKYLLDRPDVAVDVNRVMSRQMGPEISFFDYCCQIGRYDVVKAMLEKKNPDLEKTDKDGMTALSAVVWDKTGHLARIMIAKGADVHHRDSEGSCPINQAVANTNPGMLRVLLENGADPNACSDKTPLPIVQAFKIFHRFLKPTLSRMQCVRLLLKAGADLTLTTPGGMRIVDEFVEMFSRSCEREILIYSPILKDLLDLGALKRDQLATLNVFSAISPREYSFENYYRKVFRNAREFRIDIFLKPWQSKNNLDRAIKYVENNFYNYFCALAMKFYELSNKIRLPRLYEFTVEDNVFGTYYEERERIFAQTYLSKIPLDLFKSTWMDVMNPEVAEKCRLRGSTIRVMTIMGNPAGNFAKEEKLAISKEQLRPFLNDFLIYEFQPKLMEDLIDPDAVMNELLIQDDCSTSDESADILIHRYINSEDYLDTDDSVHDSD